MNLANRIFTEALVLLDLAAGTDSCVVCGNEIDEKNDGCSIFERFFIKKEKQICKCCVDSMKIIDGATCIKCGRYLEWNINKDFDSRSVKNGLCSECEKSLKNYSYVISCFEYNGLVKEMMHRLKYSGENRIAEVFGYYMAKKLIKDFVNFNSKNLRNLVIVPVPLSPEKMETRGYNQAGELANKVSEITGINAMSALVRNRDTSTQYSLTKNRRSRNIKGAFSLNIGYNVFKMHIILVDDIFTTGSTVDECAKVLNSAGASSITVLTAAGGGMKDKGMK